MTKQEAYKVFSKDMEMADIPEGDGKMTSRGFKLKHIKKIGWKCPRCGKILWGVIPEFDYHPEYSYFCDKCKWVFIIVGEKKLENIK